MGLVMILGISMSHDASVAVTTDDGRVIEALGEERLTRVKNHWGIPKMAIELVSRKYDIKKIVIGSHLNLSRKELEIFESQLLGNPSNPPGRYSPPFPGFQSNYSNTPPKRAMELLISSLLDSRVNSDKLEFVWIHHHDAHTGGALPLYPDSEFLVFSFDGHGDNVSSQVTRVSTVIGGEEARQLLRIARKDSLGSLYSACTELYNFKPNSHEGKITGLSATGASSPAIDYLRRQIRVKKGSHSIRIFQSVPKLIISRFLRSLGVNTLLPRSHIEIMMNAKGRTERYSDLAFATQKVLEEKLVEIIDFYVSKFNLSKIALTGGLFANVVFNARIAQMPGVSAVKVFPNMGDGGLSLGGIWWHLFSHQKLHPSAFPKSMFLAPETELPVDSLIEFQQDPQLTVTKMDEDLMIPYICEKLSSGKLIGVHKGRMEFGPRALCNRSILIDPRSKAINRSVNLRLRRTEFMPFAPVVTFDRFERYFKSPQDELFPFYWMTMVCDVRDAYRDLLAAVTHVDGTARPQIIKEQDDLFMYSILKEFEKRSGVACLVNTSFNLHEEPINYLISHSISALKQGAVDILVIPGFLIEVKDN